MRHRRNPILGRIMDQGLEHPARTTVAAVASLVVAGAFKLPETYWAAITTLVVMQSTLGAAWKVSGQRFAGTALGAAAGAVLAMYLRLCGRPHNGKYVGISVMLARFSKGFIGYGQLGGYRHIKNEAPNDGAPFRSTGDPEDGSLRACARSPLRWDYPATFSCDARPRGRKRPELLP